MAEDNKIVSPLNYLEKFKKLKSVHSQIQSIIDKNSRILEEMKIPFMQTMTNLNKYSQQIKEKIEDEEYGEIYKEMTLISDTLPNYDREQINFNTLNERQKDNLVNFIIEVIEAVDNIRTKVEFQKVEIPKEERWKKKKANVSNVEHQ